ncbi:MAG TPA: calcium-binding protein [Solirubrobacterales bacterium]|nr:calcium-binding protein [Solirubrobacterales bacterium]
MGVHTATTNLSPRLSAGRVLVGLLLVAAMFVQMEKPASASIYDRDTCRKVESGPKGPRGDYVSIHRKNWLNGATLLYRDHRRIRFFTTEGIRSHMGWRGQSREIRCSPVTVRDVDRIVIKVKRTSRHALVIDQSGRGLRSNPGSRPEFQGPGGPFSPGASGKGIRIEMKGQSPRRGDASYLLFAGSRRADHVYLSRTAGLISLRSRSVNRRLGELLGFNADKVHVLLGPGDDLMEAGGLGPDPDFNSFDLRAWGGKGDDRLLGHEGRDRNFIGGPGDDLLDGRAGDDRDTGNSFGLVGGSGDDVILGGSGNDWIEGESGFDTIRPGSGEDQVYEEDGQFDLIDCGFNPLAYIVFDASLDELVNCVEP